MTTMQLIEHYLSIQGEGFDVGKPAYFVRFARCNMRCAWCDSTYTFGNGQSVNFSTVIRAIRKSNAQFVCLTGGEPLLYPAECIRLIRHFPRLRFLIETGGSIEIASVQRRNSSVIMDWKLKRSGMSHKMNEKNLFFLRRNFDLLKFVTDGSKAEKKEMMRIIKKTCNMGFPISLQPVFGIDIGKLAEWMIGLKNPRLQFNVQIHKYIWPSIQSGI